MENFPDPLHNPGHKTAAKKRRLQAREALGLAVCLSLFPLTPRFQCSVTASIAQIIHRVVVVLASCMLVVCLLLSVSYIGICDCVCYLYLSSICFFVRYLLRSCVSGAEHGSTKFLPSTSIICGRCRLFRGCRKDVAYNVETVHRIGCFLRAFFVTTNWRLLIMLAY